MSVLPRKLLILVLSAMLWLPASLRADAQLSRHPYLQTATPESINVVWRTVGGTIPILRYGPTPDALTNEVLPVQMVVRLGPDIQGSPVLPRLHSAPPGTYQYEAPIYGLRPATTYYYAIYDGDRLLAGGDADHSFTTLPSPGSSDALRLWVVGDTGSGNFWQKSSFARMRELVAQEGRRVDHYLHLGDIAYYGGLDSEYSAHFFDIYTELLRNTVCWPTMGNHEFPQSSGVTQTGPYYDAYVMPTFGESGGLASGTEAYYSFDIGPVHFICLDSHDLDRSPSGEMARWLKADLEMASAEWLVAFWHHPPYSKGTVDTDRDRRSIQMREFILPILESHGVDLILSGHSHVYERSMLVDGAYHTPSSNDGVVLDDGDGDPAGHGAYRKSESLTPNGGTLAVVSGHGRTAAASFGQHPLMRRQITSVGSVLIDVDGDTLTGRMLDWTGEVRDVFQLVKRGTVEQVPIEYPWAPKGPGFLVQRLSSGRTQVEILADPPAPDAVIYYTLDGSVPTTDSAVYDGPIVVGDTIVVRAFSQWRDGTRSSLVSASEKIPGGISFRKYVAAETDDGKEYDDGVVDLGGELIEIDAEGVAGFRFEGVEIPPDAWLISGRLQFSQQSISNLSSDGFVWGELVADSSPFTGENGEFSGRQRTTHQVSWNTESWTTLLTEEEPAETPDLSKVLDEIISQPDWRSGNAMSFFVTKSLQRVAAAFESAPSLAASLSVTYLTRELAFERVSSGLLEVGRAEDGQGIQLTFDSPSPSAKFYLGLNYEFEASRDLIDWVPIRQDSFILGAIGEDGYGRLTATFDPDHFEGDEQFYVRMIVSLDPE